jgi:hypothetical protein
MKPHVACRCRELEKHLRDVWYGAARSDLLRGDDIAETVRIVCGV